MNNPPLPFGKRATACTITFGCIFIAKTGIDLLRGVVTPIKAQLHTEHGQLVQISSCSALNRWQNGGKRALLDYK